MTETDTRESLSVIADRLLGTCWMCLNAISVVAGTSGSPRLWNIFIVSDYVSGGELFTHLYQREKFTEDEVRIYIGEIILALEHLHKVGTLPHRKRNEAQWDAATNFLRQLVGIQLIYTFSQCFLKREFHFSGLLSSD